MPVETKETTHPSTVYGPVRSWRFGMSLGIDPIVETSTCSFNCIYCQLGNIQRITAERREFVVSGKVREDLEAVDWTGVDVVTISGSGEPTLATNLGEIVEAIRERTDRPIHILTNATLLHLPEARGAVAGIDVVSCKLDAPDDAALQRINRPAPGITLGGIVAGILALKEEYTGRLTLQVMFMPANVSEVERWVPLIRRIKPAEVQLNTPRRPYPLGWYLQSRGDHASEHCPHEKRQLKTITPAQARQAEARLEELTGVEVVSVYQD